MLEDCRLKCFLHERLVETENDAHGGNATGLSTERKKWIEIYIQSLYTVIWVTTQSLKLLTKIYCEGFDWMTLFFTSNVLHSKSSNNSSKKEKSVIIYPHSCSFKPTCCCYISQQQQNLEESHSMLCMKLYDSLSCMRNNWLMNFIQIIFPSSELIIQEPDHWVSDLTRSVWFVNKSFCLICESDQQFIEKELFIHKSDFKALNI